MLGWEICFDKKGTTRNNKARKAENNASVLGINMTYAQR
jgi:hypothetical protein